MVPTTNPEPRITHYAPRKAENSVPSLSFEKTGTKIQNISDKAKHTYNNIHLLSSKGEQRVAGI